MCNDKIGFNINTVICEEQHRLKQVADSEDMKRTILQLSDTLADVSIAVGIYSKEAMLDACSKALENKDIVGSEYRLMYMILKNTI